MPRLIQGRLGEAERFDLFGFSGSLRLFLCFIRMGALLATAGFAATAQAQTYSFPNWGGSANTASYQDADGSFTISWPHPQDTAYLYHNFNGSTTTYTYHYWQGLSKSFSSLSPGVHQFTVKKCWQVDDWDESYEECQWNSRTIKVTVPQPLQPPSSPPSTFNVPASDGDGAYTLSWSSVPGTNYYQLQEQVNSGTWVGLPNITGTSRAISGKDNGVYGYRIRACNDAGCSGYSTVKTTTVVKSPGIPSSLDLSVTTSGNRLDVNWLASSGSVSSYQLQRRFNNGSWATVYSGSTRIHSHTGLGVGYYQYQVRACYTLNSYTSCSAYRGSVTSYVAGVSSHGYANDLDVFTLSASSGYSTIQYIDLDGGFALNWSPMTGQSYYYLRQLTPTVVNYHYPNTGGLTRTFESLPDGFYTFKVDGCHWVTDEDDLYGWDECVSTNTLQIRVQKLAAVPGVPSSLSVGSNPAATDTGLPVTWGVASGSVSYYDLDYQLNGGAWADAYSGGSTSTTLNLTNAGDYNFRVRACNTVAGNASCSGWRNASATLIHRPAPLVDIYVDGSANNTTGSFGIVWSDNWDSTVSYTVFESHNGGTAVSRGSYDYTYEEDWTYYGKNFSGKPQGQYVYTVKKCQQTICRDTSVTVNVAYNPGIPGAIAVNINPVQINETLSISWGAASGTVTKYDFDYRLNSGSYIHGYDGTGTTASVSNLSVGQYGLQVRACNVVGSFNNCSGWRTATVDAVLARTPGSPTYLSVDPATVIPQGTLVFDWNEGAGTKTHYVLAYKLLSVSQWTTAYSGPNTAATLSGQELGLVVGNYSFSVKTCNSANGGTSCSGEKTASVTVMVPPAGSPSTFNVPASDGDGAFTVSWSTVSGASYYRLEKLDSNGQWPVVYSGSALNRFISGLSSGTHSYRISACNAVGCSSPSQPKDAIVYIVPPETYDFSTIWSGIGETIRYVDYDGTFTLTWPAAPAVPAAIGGITYKLYRTPQDGQPYHGYAGLSKSYSTLPVGSYSFRLDACHYEYNAEDDWDEEVCRTNRRIVELEVRNPPTSAPGAAPGGLTVPASSSTGIYPISWNSVVNATKYRLEEYSETTGWALIQDLGNTSAQIDGKGSGAYSYRVTACNHLGCGPTSASQSINIAIQPAAPSPVEVLLLSNDSLKVSWNETDESQYYDVEQKYNGGSWGLVYSGNGINILFTGTLDLPVIIPLSSGEITFSELGAGAYNYRVRACNKTGSFGSCSNWVTSTTTAQVMGAGPTTPNDDLDGYSFSSLWVGWQETLQYLDYDGTFTVNWPVNNAPYTDFYFLTQDTSQGPLAGDRAWGNSYSYESLPDGVYTFSLQGCYEYDPNDPSVEECVDNSVSIRVVVQRHAPSTPSWLEVPETDSNGMYTVSWGDSRGATFYVLEESINGGTWSQVTLDSPDAQNILLENKGSGSYSYRVKGCYDSSLCSQPTLAQSIDVALSPESPTFIDVTPVLGDGEHAVIWSQAGGDVTYYDLDQSYDGEPVWSNVYAGGQLSKSLPEAGQPLLPAGGYVYRVRTCNAVGSNINCSDFIHSLGALIAQPDPPTITAPAYTLTNQYEVSWNAVANSNAYRVEESLSGSGIWDQLTLESSTDTEVSVAHTSGEYDYRVQACNRQGCGDYSPIATVQVIDQLPGVPGNIQGPSGSDGGDFELSWTAPATGGTVEIYELDQEKDNGGMQTIYRGPALNYTVIGAMPGNYAYQARACNAAGQCGGNTPVKLVSVTDGSGGGSVQIPPQPVLTDASQFAVDTVAIDQTLTTDGEFKVSPSGQAGYSIKIMTAPAGGQFVPQISLNYSSGAGNGLVGLGWSIGGLDSIRRCRQTQNQDNNAMPITWGADDRFCLNGERLLVDPQYTYGAPGSTYKTEIDSYARITAIGGTLGNPDTFKVEYKNGIVSYFGENSGNGKYKLADKTLGWAISRKVDSAGNKIQYNYYSNPTAGEQRIQSIQYAFDDSGTTNVAELEFEYETRQDQISGYINGDHYTTNQRLSAIESNNGGQQLREYRLSYNEGSAQNANDALSRLTSIRECVDGQCLQPTEFEWALPQAALSNILTGFGFEGGVSDFRTGDINGDGLIDVVWLEEVQRVYPMQDNIFHSRALRYALGTINSNGDFVFVQGEFEGGGYPMLNSRVLNLVDINGDGRMDVVYGGNGPTTSYLALLSKPQADGSWKLAKTTTSFLNSILSPDTSFADVDGDGLADALSWMAEKPWLAYHNENSFYASVSYARRRHDADPGSSTFYDMLTRKALRHHLEETSHIPSQHSAEWGQPDADYLVIENGQVVENRMHLAPIYSMTGQSGDFNGDGRMDVLAYIYEAHQGCYQDHDFDGCDWMWTWPAIFSAHEAEDEEIELRYHSTLYNFTIDNGIIVDLNNDGLSDAVYPGANNWVFRLNNGITLSDSVIIPVPNRPFGTHNRNNTDVAIADWNGDGYPDFIWHSPNAPFDPNTSTGLGEGSIKVMYWNPATESFDPTARFIASASYYISENYNDDRYGWNFGFTRFKRTPAINVMDINGDGKPDLVFTPNTQGGDFSVTFGAGGTVPENRIVAVTTGSGKETQIQYQPLSRSDHYADIEGVNATTQQTVCQPTDVGSTCWSRQVATSSQDDFYRGINDPWRDLTEEHQSLKPIHPVLALKGPMYVVTDVATTAPDADAGLARNIDNQAMRRTSYYFEQARAQAAGIGSLGFKSFTAVDHQTGIRTTTRYRQDWPYNGLALESISYSAQGHKLSETHNTWHLMQCYEFYGGNVMPGCAEKLRDKAFDGTSILGSIQPFLQNTETITYDLVDNGAAQGSQLKRQTVEQAFDRFGNDKQNTTVIYDDSDAVLLTKVTDNTYTYGGASYSSQMGKLRRMRVSSTNQLGTIVRTSAFDYWTDGDAKGLIKNETIEPDNAQLAVTTTHYYDDFGNKVKSVTTADGQTRYARVEYDSFGRYVDKTYALLNDANGSTIERLISEVVSRDKFGNPTETRTYVDANSNVTAITATTAFGIPYFAADSTGAYTVTIPARGADGNVCPPNTSTHVKATSAGGGESIGCHDILGREVRKATRMFDGINLSVVDTEYDKLDRVVRASEPYALNGSAYWTVNKNYDILSRVGEVDHPLAGAKTTFTYSGYRTSMTNALNQTRVEIGNALGQKVTVIDPVSGQTTFQHDARGNLRFMGDPAGNTTEIHYDLLDRKDWMNDPDKGYWQYRYNRFNELVCQIDAKGQIIRQAYDHHGRLMNRVDYTGNGGTGIGNCSSPGGSMESNTVWTYDTAANGRGQLASVVDLISGYEKRINYDSLGRVNQTATILPGLGGNLETHYEKVTYDQHGRPFQIFDAARNAPVFDSNGIQHHYNAYGYLESIVNAVDTGQNPVPYYKVTGMDARGNVTDAFYGSNVTQHADYVPETGLARRLWAYNDSNLAPIQNLELDWDLVGNLNWRKETGLGDSTDGTSRNFFEQFYYDGLNQLTDYTVNTASYQVQYDETTGNITSKTGVGSYKYGNDCTLYGGVAAGPHAVCAVDNGNGTVIYGYDANGNQTGGDGRTITYTVFDKPKTISKNGHTTQFDYGPDRARYKRTDNGGQFAQPTTTLYLGNVEKIHHADGTIEWKRSIGGVAILIQKFDASGTETAQSEHYLLKDHLGSINLITNGVGEVIEEMDFDPWGKRRNTDTWEDMQDEYKRTHHGKFADPKPVTHRGYTGHEALDEVGLIHMNGRIYDDTLARFVQADPIIQDPYRTQSLNRYSYVWNNPLNANDPSGFESQQCAGTNCKESPPPPPQREKQLDKGGCYVNTCYSGASAAARDGVSTGKTAYTIITGTKEGLEQAKELLDKHGVSYKSISSEAVSDGGVNGDAGQTLDGIGEQAPAIVRSQDTRSTVASQTTLGNGSNELKWQKLLRDDEFVKTLNRANVATAKMIKQIATDDPNDPSSGMNPEKTYMNGTIIKRNRTIKLFRSIKLPGYSLETGQHVFDGSQKNELNWVQELVGASQGSSSKIQDAVAVAVIVPQRFAIDFVSIKATFNKLDEITPVFISHKGKNYVIEGNAGPFEIDY